MVDFVQCDRELQRVHFGHRPPYPAYLSNTNIEKYHILTLVCMATPEDFNRYCNKENHRKVLFNSSHLNGHNSGFYPQIEKDTNTRK